MNKKIGLSLMLFSFVGFVSANVGDFGYSMMGGNYGYGAMGFMGLMMILVIVVLVLLVIWLSKQIWGK